MHSPPNSEDLMALAEELERLRFRLTDIVGARRTLADAAQTLTAWAATDPQPTDQLTIDYTWRP